MALARFQRTITDALGNIKPGSSVTVRHETVGAPLASLFSDRDGTTGIGNPITADSEGFAAFHVAGGSYRIDAVSGGETTTWRYVGIGLASETDGVVAGFKFKFSDAVTDSDPGAGFVRFNNATYASITQLYISDINADGIDVSNWLSALSSGTMIISSVDGAGLLNVSITGAAVDGTDYWKIPVSITVSSDDATFLDGVDIGVATAGDGADGTNGIDGVSGGIAFTFSTSTDTASDPGTANIRFNNASLASVTEIAIDDQSAETGNPDVSAWVASFANSTNNPKGTITIQKTSAQENFVIYDVTAVTDATTHNRLTVTHVSSSGSFSATDGIAITFAAAGDAGIDGATGPAGADGTNGTDGADGTNGTDGVSGGLPFTFSTSTDTASDPGTANIRFNNASLASVTEIAVDDQSAASGNPDISAFVSTWAASTNAAIKAHLIIKDSISPENFAIYTVASLVDATTHNRVTVAHVDSSGSMTNGNDITVEFIRVGDKGADGAGSGDVTGPGATVSDNEVVLFDTTSGQAIKGSGSLFSAIALDGGAHHDGFSDFVANEHIDHSGVSITAGNGLTGGGDITTTRNIAVGGGTGITVNADDIETNDSEIDHDALNNFVANEHIDHSGVSITAGNGLTGGGDITTTRNIAVGGGTGITVNADDIAVSSNTRTAAISIVIDGGGATITTGVKGDLTIPFDCTIQAVTMLADQSGSAVVDIWKDTYVNYPPLVGDSITASALPTITTDVKSTDATLTGWTTAITAGDTLRFNVNSATTIQRLTLVLEVLKT